MRAPVTSNPAELDSENKRSSSSSSSNSLPFLQLTHVADSHVLSDRCVADGVGGGRNGRLAAVAAAAAVQAGHVHAVQVVVVLPPSVAQRLVLAVFVTPADGNNAVTKHHRQREPLYHSPRSKKASPMQHW